MRLLVIGDVVGKPGRLGLRATLPRLRAERSIDLAIVNGENAAGGVGLTADTALELLQCGADVLTGGNHIWKYKDLIKLLDKEPRLLRPFNYPQTPPGRGFGVFETQSGVPVGVVNLIGRTFMDPVPCPFAAADEAVGALAAQTRIIVVEFHAEATSEKRALGWYLDGRASVVYGTHTHVPTADEEIFPNGTGYITDLGMTGPYASVIGMQKDEMIEKFMTLRPSPFVVAQGDVRVCGAIFDIDEASGKTRHVERVQERICG